jgi:hypothetical protein
MSLLVYPMVRDPSVYCVGVWVGFIPVADAVQKRKTPDFAPFSTLFVNTRAFHFTDRVNSAYKQQQQQ